MKFPLATPTRIPRKPDIDTDPVRRGQQKRRSVRWRGIIPRLAALAAGAAVGIGLYVSLPSPQLSPSRSGAFPQVRVSGNELVSAGGRPVVLHGVDRSGTEYECVQGHGIFDGPSNKASISVMRSRGINAVRVPLNEACWNGESYVAPA